MPNALWCGHKMIFLSLQSRGSGLGLSSAHEQNVSEFLRFARFKRGQCVKTVETAFQHLADSRLVEDTFTCEGGGKWEARGKLPSIIACGCLGGDRKG